MQRLDELELHVLSCTALGMTNGLIANKTFLSVTNVKTYLANMRQKFGVDGRTALGEFYLRNCLHDDLWGEPFDETLRRYDKPGDKFQDWLTWAEKQRSTLTQAGLLTPKVREAVRLYIDPAHADKSAEELAPRLFIAEPTFKSHIGRVNRCLRVEVEKARPLAGMTEVKRVLLATIFTLAPLQR